MARVVGASPCYRSCVAFVVTTGLGSRRVIPLVVATLGLSAVEEQLVQLYISEFFYIKTRESICDPVIFRWLPTRLDLYVEEGSCKKDKLEGVDCVFIDCCFVQRLDDCWVVTHEYYFVPAPWLSPFCYGEKDCICFFPINVLCSVSLWHSAWKGMRPMPSSNSFYATGISVEMEITSVLTN